MGDSLNFAHSISFDGSTKTTPTITAPSADYTKNAPHAIVKGELYIFGGRSDKQKIAKLVGCHWKEQTTRTINQYVSYSAALSIEDGDKALICFPTDSERKKCEIFDSTTNVSTFSTNFMHTGGKLGFYNGLPTTVGSGNKENNKVETLSSSGWTSNTDFPSKMCYHVLMGLPSGSLLLAGGYDPDRYGYRKEIWILTYDTAIWRLIGNLQNADYEGSVIMISNSVFIVSGRVSPYPIERLDFQEDKLVNQEVIGNNGERYNYSPVLYEVSADYCV